MLRNEIAAVVALSALAGCETPYQERSIFGGVSAERVDSNTYRITGDGNGYTSAARVREFILLKSAETARSAGFTHFTIVGVKDESITRYSPGVSVRIPTAVATVDLSNGAAGPNSFEAEKIIATLGPRLKSKKA
jgi:hypothetical protein